MASKRDNLMRQFNERVKYDWGDGKGKTHTRPKGAQYRSNAPKASTAPPASTTPALTPGQQTTVGSMESAYKALSPTERLRAGGARRSVQKYKWAGEKVARHMRPKGAQYRSNAQGGPADYLHYQGKGARYNWGDGKGTVHTHPKKGRSVSMP